MDISKIVGITFACLLLLSASALYGREVGRQMEQQKETPVLISDRLKECEEKGGRYGMYFSDFDEKYTDYCKTEEKNIKLTK